MSDVKIALQDAQNMVVDTNNEILENIGLIARHLLAIRVSARKVAGQTAMNLSQTDWGNLLSQISFLEEAVLIAERGLIDAVAHVQAAVDDANRLATLSPSEQHSLSDPQVRANVWAMTGGICTYCNVQLTDDGKGGGTAFCIEHVIPVSKGGPNHLTNYVPSCLSCNSAKGDRHVLHFIRNVLPNRVSNVVPIRETPASAEVAIKIAGEQP